SRVHRPGRHRLQPAREAGARPEGLGRAGRHRVGGGGHPAPPEAIPARGYVESVGECIRLYLTRYERCASPLFVVGESYGTTRAAGLSGYLVEKGIAFNGIMLISSILNFQTTDGSPGNDLPFILFLPTYASAAWYHKKLGPEYEQ